MSLRALGPVFLTAASVAWAPMQCQSDPPAEQNRYEHPPEALYALSKRLRTAGEVKAWRMTLETIVDQYPNSREAVMAKDDLENSAVVPRAETSSDP
ncbi:MAG TPA: hypothetical protein VFU02_24460 [Polyangiaceae bacterium]|nr:hypothetical protein [Polyangiaceae bacterium]